MYENHLNKDSKSDYGYSSASSDAWGSPSSSRSGSDIVCNQCTSEGWSCFRNCVHGDNSKHKVDLCISGEARTMLMSMVGITCSVNCELLLTFFLDV